MICYMFTEVSYWHTGLAAVTPFVALSELMLGFSGIRMLSGKEDSGKEDSGKEDSGKEDVRSQATDPVTMKFYVVCEKRGLTVGTRTKTASDWLITLTGSRKLFSPTSVYMMTLRAGQLTSPHGFLRLALPRLQLFTKGNLMLDKKSCDSLLAEDDSTPRTYERAYHSCKYIHYTVDPLSLFDPLRPLCTLCSDHCPCLEFYLYLYHLLIL